LDILAWWRRQNGVPRQDNKHRHTWWK